MGTVTWLVSIVSSYIMICTRTSKHTHTSGEAKFRQNPGKTDTACKQNCVALLWSFRNGVGDCDGACVCADVLVAGVWDDR